MSELTILDILLVAGALIGTIWALVPPVAFFIGLTRIRHVICDDPSRAEPTVDDLEYARRFAQFVDLGFQSAGVIVEKCWFVNAYEWYHQSGDVRWLASRDGHTLASLHRLTVDE